MDLINQVDIFIGLSGQLLKVWTNEIENMGNKKTNFALSALQMQAQGPCGDLLYTFVI